MVARTALTVLFSLSAASAHLHHPHRDAARPFVERQADPHAIPSLPQISQGMPTEPPVPLSATPVAGAPPTISGAPKLPAIPNMSGYPVVPYGQRIPTDSPEVKKWLAEVAASGIQIPNLKPNAILPDDAPAGTTLCSLNPDASAASGADKNCWWSCGLCTRQTDVVTCPDKLAWGLTFDDGPSPYTPKVLNYLADKKLKASFYVIGANIVNHPEILQATYIAGHEIAIHTWTHPQMTTLTNEQIVAELGWTRQAIQAVLGVTPRYFRPPYGDCDDRVRAIAKAMGLTPVIWTDGFDTDDWSVNSGSLSTDLFNGYTKMLDALPNQPAGVISLQHDWYQGTVDLAVGYFLPAALSHNPAPAFQPVIQCQHQPMGASYVETSGGSVPPPSSNNATVTPSATASASHATGSTGTTKTGTNTSASPSATGSANSASALCVGVGAMIGVAVSVWSLI
ncbi:chitin deacetylase [Ceratobasidium sp. UAMH 11750]|nr:chitin deacetylase [Ceratobasidium sp. UAMH 11750]